MDTYERRGRGGVEEEGEGRSGRREGGEEWRRRGRGGVVEEREGRSNRREGGEKW